MKWSRGVAGEVQGGSYEESARGCQVVGGIALLKTANTSWGVGAVDRGANMLEKDVFESSRRSFDVRVQEGNVISRETTERGFPEGERCATSPVGMPILSRGRKASKSSKSRTERNRVTRERIPDDLGTG